MTVITTPDALKGYGFTRLDFEKLASLGVNVVGTFGGGGTQPYLNLGLRFLFPAEVSIQANMNSSSGGVGLCSGILSKSSYEIFLAWAFSSPKRAVGFFYRDLGASSIHVRAYDADDRIIEKAAFQGGEGYAGFIRDQEDIVAVEVSSMHRTLEDVAASTLCIDDLAFSSEGWWRRFFRHITIRFGWAWTLLVGYILLTPVGPLCLVCEHPIGGFWIRLLGLGTLVLGGLGLWWAAAGPRVRD